MLFAHGFGCDQNMWRLMVPAFEADHKVVLMDHVGAGGSDLGAYDRAKYGTLDGYASDLLELIEELDLSDVVFVGHSVSAMIGVLAAHRNPAPFGALVLVGPSPRYINDDGYEGGFSRQDIDELLDSLDSNYLGWSSAMAPAIMGNADRPELGTELANSFCRTDPTIARQFARVTFLSDNRADLAQVTLPTLILQCSDDVIAPASVGEFVHAQMPGSVLVRLKAIGHCPNLSAPEETAAAIRTFLRAHVAMAGDPRPVGASRPAAGDELYEDAPCAHLSTLPDGTITRGNRTLMAWLGRPSEDVVGTRFQAHLTVGSRIYYETHYSPLLQMQGFVNEIALEMRLASGEVRPVVASARQLRDAQGAATENRIALFDSTDRRRYERETPPRPQGRRAGGQRTGRGRPAEERVHCHARARAAQSAGADPRRGSRSCGAPSRPAIWSAGRRRS